MVQVQTWETIKERWHKRIAADEQLTIYADALINAARPAIRIRQQAGTAAIGASKFGGAPDLPEDMGYPKHAHLPMTFVAQLNLAELSRADAFDLFPKQGLLSFFLPEDDTDLSNCQSLLYFPDISNLRRLDGPSSVDVFDEATIEYEPDLSLPEPFSQVAHEIFGVPDGEDAFPHVRHYLDWHMWELGQQAAAIKIGGYPMSAHGYVLEQTVRKDLQLDADMGMTTELTDDYVRLFQTRARQHNHKRTIWLKGWEFFWLIHREDLRHANFNNVFGHIEDGR